MAKVGKLSVNVRMKRWAKPFVVACLLLRLRPPRWAFSCTVVPE